MRARERCVTRGVRHSLARERGRESERCVREGWEEGGDNDASRGKQYTAIDARREATREEERKEGNEEKVQRTC